MTVKMSEKITWSTFTGRLTEFELKNPPWNFHGLKNTPCSFTCKPTTKSIESCVYFTDFFWISIFNMCSYGELFTGVSPIVCITRIFCGCIYLDWVILSWRVIQNGTTRRHLIKTHTISQSKFLKVGRPSVFVVLGHKYSNNSLKHMNILYTFKGFFFSSYPDIIVTLLIKIIW